MVPRLAKGRCPAANPPFMTTQSNLSPARLLGNFFPKGTLIQVLINSFFLSNIQHRPAKISSSNVTESSFHQSIPYQPSPTGNIQHCHCPHVLPPHVPQGGDQLITEVISTCLQLNLILIIQSSPTIIDLLDC